MANDLTSNHMDNSDHSAILPKNLTAGSLYTSDSSYASDNLSKAWEYDLYKVDKAPALYDRDAARETLKLLWQSGDAVSSTDFSAGKMTGLTDLGTGSLTGLTDLGTGSLTGFTDLGTGSLTGLTDLGVTSRGAASSRGGTSSRGAASSRAGTSSRSAASSRGGTSSRRTAVSPSAASAARAGETGSQRSHTVSPGTSGLQSLHTVSPGTSGLQSLRTVSPGAPGSQSPRAAAPGASAPGKSRAGRLIRNIFLLYILITLVAAAYTSLAHRDLRYLIYRYTHDLDLPEDLFNDFPNDLLNDLPGNLFNDDTGDGTNDDTGDGTNHGTDVGKDTGTDDADDYTNPYPDGQILTEFGYDYSDFYTPKYIASYDSKWIDTSDHKYQELCVIDSEPYIGTGQKPVNPQNNWWLISEPTSHTLGFYDGDGSMSYGFTVRYADSMDKDPFCFPDLLQPPATADKNAFRQKIIDVYTADTDNYDPGFSVLRLSKVREITIGDHNITYNVVTGEDKKGSGVVDVLSIEEKPSDSAFITEYRYKDGEFTDPEEALRSLYGMLDFRTEDFEYIAASNCLFSVARVYNSDNSCAAKIDLSRLGNVRSSEMMQKNRVDFELGEYGQLNRPTTTIRCEYLDYRDVDYYGGPEEWAAQMLEEAQSQGEYPSEIPEGSLKKLRVFRCDAYSLTLEGVEERGGEEEKIVNHLCRIETPEGGELMLDLEFVHDIPEDFDMEQFLRRNVKIESGE